ncbi:MAG: hypothetical protein FJW39_10615 [Acidobacteria bacterium]|nr:hypothetical protein [Acidobacteriota bacterium]
MISKSGTPGAAISVGCRNAAGAGVDTQYDVLYLTTPLSPASLTVASGSAQSTQVNVAFSNPLQALLRDANIPLPGFNIGFSAPGSGATATLSGATAATNASGIAQVNATANNTPGTYNVTASLGGLSTQFNLSNTAPGGLAILKPVNNQVLTNSVVTFEWAPAPGASQTYDFRVFNQNTGDLVLKLNFIGSLTSQVYTFNSGVYRIEMKACNPACGPTVFSAFTVQLPPPPTTTPTITGCNVVNDNSQNRVNCNWPAVPGADFYFINLVQQGTGPGGGALTVAGTQVGATSASLLAPNGTLFVFIRACNGDGCGPQSAAFQVNTSFGNPAIPILAEPFGGSVIDAGTNVAIGVFTWSRVAGDNGSNFLYRLYVQDFSRNLPAVDIITSSNFHAAHLNPSTRYDALVIAIPVGGGNSISGPAQGFLVKGRIPNTPTAVSPTVFITAPAGNTTFLWTPIPQANGDLDGRVYEYDLSNGGQTFTGGTQNIQVNLNLPAGNYTGNIRACLVGTTCTAGNDTGWGPRSGTPGSEGGGSTFRLQ